LNFELLAMGLANERATRNHSLAGYFETACQRSSEFRMQDSKFRIQDSAFGNQDPEFSIQSSAFNSAVPGSIF
jgi:hypothetical protein